jgi:hypothetical protein
LVDLAGSGTLSGNVEPVWAKGVLTVRNHRFPWGLSTLSFTGNSKKSITKTAQPEETRSQKNGGSKALVKVSKQLSW